MQTLTVVMYHYVRNTEQTPYPGIKALSVSEFQGQLDYLQQHYDFVGVEDVLAFLKGDGSPLSPNSVLLTFDDGYRDHYDTVLPILKGRKISGVFFPPAKPIIERQVLDVNKIQFVLSQEPDTRNLIDVINKTILENQDRYSLNAPENYWNRYTKGAESAKGYRFDSAEVIFVKRMLQHGLPHELRSELIAALFGRYVTKDEKTFVEELYLSIEHLREMAAEGMCIGSHGYNHYWMDRLSVDEQRTEIALSLEFLKSIGRFSKEWVMCYPFGGYNDSLVDLVEKMGCKLGFTTKTGIAKLDENHPLCLPRYDTNDLPKTL